ncbi:MAG: DUF4440 domain-containing protein [Gilvibacter sp.]
MRQLLSTIIISVFLCSFTGHAQTYAGDPKEIDQILKNIEAFSVALMKADYQFVTESYTKDAKIFPDNTKILAGSEAILNYWTPKSDWRIKYHKVTPDEIKIIGDEAYDYGYYEGKSANPSGEESNWKGKYVIVWKKVDGQWKIYLDIWNRVREGE